MPLPGWRGAALCLLLFSEVTFSVSTDDFASANVIREYYKHSKMVGVLKAIGTSVVI